MKFVHGRRFSFSVLLIALIQAAMARGEVNPATVGAHVDETLATLQVYVNPSAPGASDGNPGSETQPVATIARATRLALDANGRGIGARVRIAAGTYRETIRVDGSAGSTSAPIVLEAIANGTVTISGSDVWADWTADGAGTFTHAWTNAWGPAPYPNGWDCCVVLSELARRREMVVVNGTRLRQVASASAVTAGTFYVSDADRQLRLAPPAGVNLGAATVEVAQRSALVMIQNRSNVVLRGIRVQHDASAIGGTGALSVYSASNVLLENLNLDVNNSRGLSLADTSRVSIRGTTANDNGFGGVAGWKMRSTLMDNTQALRNNWRGLDTDFTDWDPAGIKLMLLHDAALLGVTTSNNQSYGLWLDTDCADVLVRGLTSNDNLNDGVFLEAIEGPVTIDNATLSRNGRSGLLIGNAAAGTLSGSTLIDNRQAQVLISGTPLGRPADNFETGQVYPALQSTGWTFAGNTFHALTSAQSVSSTTLPSAVWQAFVDSLTSDFNSWYHPTNNQPFVWTGGLKIDFESWKSRTQQDRHSVFAALRVPRPPANVRLIK